ncbi:hypothetical protein D030_2818B, partial [Vibrio parahaemolyticus AQ3810]
PKHS